MCGLGARSPVLWRGGGAKGRRQGYAVNCTGLNCHKAVDVQKCCCAKERTEAGHTCQGRTYRGSITGSSCTKRPLHRVGPNVSQSNSSRSAGSCCSRGGCARHGIRKHLCSCNSPWPLSLVIQLGACQDRPAGQIKQQSCGAGAIYRQRHHLLACCSRQG